jgi:hypothetical protein
MCAREDKQPKLCSVLIVADLPVVLNNPALQSYSDKHLAEQATETPDNGSLWHNFLDPFVDRIRLSALGGR